MLSIQFGAEKFEWSKEVVKHKLEAIGQLKDKTVSWIQSDLSTTNSSLISRFIWSFFAKHFNCLRERLFGVNLEKSQSLLQQIGEKLHKTDDPLIAVYNTAAEKFNAIAPSHKVSTFAFQFFVEEAKGDDDQKKGIEQSKTGTQQVEETAPPRHSKIEENPPQHNVDHNDKGKIIQDNPQQDRIEHESEAVEAESTEINILDPVQVGIESANQYLAHCLKEGVAIDSKECHKFQNATELDINHARFPISRASLETIFAYCTDLKNVVLLGKLNLEKYQEGQGIIDDFGPELDDLESLQFLLHQGSKKAITFQIPNFSPSTYAELLAKLPGKERTDFFKLIQKTVPDQENAFLIEAISLVETTPGLSKFLSFILKDLNKFEELCENFKSLWVKQFKLPELKEFNGLMSVINCSDLKQQEPLLNILLKLGDENDVDVLKLFYEQIEEEVKNGFEIKDYHETLVQVCSYQIFQILRSEDPEKEANISKVYNNLCSVYDEGFGLLGTRLSQLCTVEEIPLIISSFTKYSKVEKWKLCHKFMSGLLQSGDREAIRAGFRNYWPLERKHFCGNRTLPGYFVKFLPLIDSKMKFEEVINALSNELQADVRRKYIRNLALGHSNIRPVLNASEILNVLEAQVGENKKAIDLMRMIPKD